MATDSSAPSSQPQIPVKSWADIEQDNEDDAFESGGLERYDEDGFKIVTTYFREADGRQMKREKKLKVTRRVERVPMDAKRRQKEWKKFGYESLDFSKGDNKKFSTSSSIQDEILQAPKNLGLLAPDNQDDYGILIGNNASSGGVELNAHKRQLTEIQKYFDMLADADPRPLLNLLIEKEDVHLAAAAAMQSTDRQMRRDNDDCTVRVTNLSEYTDENELKMLFNRCGEVSRHFLARNKETNVSKGFAFITYKTRAEAEKAIKMLHKHGFGNVLLNVEWAKRKPQPNEP